MKLTLNIDGKEKVFTAPFVSARHLRTLMIFDEEIDYSNMKTDEVDRLVGFVSDVYDKQFTPDEFYDGVESSKLIDTIVSVVVYVRTGKTPEDIEKEQEEQGNETGK